MRIDNIDQLILHANKQASKAKQWKLIANKLANALYRSKTNRLSEGLRSQVLKEYEDACREYQ